MKIKMFHFGHKVTRNPVEKKDRKVEIPELVPEGYLGMKVHVDPLVALAMGQLPITRIGS